MTPTNSLRTALFALGLATLLSAGCTTSSTAPSADQTKADSLESLTYAGSQAPLATLDAEIAAAGTHPAKLDALAGRLLALLRDPASTFAARQAVCERLREFPVTALTTGDALHLFAGMLADPKQIELARLAVERVPDPEIDALFLNALKAASPATRLALIQSAGNRHLVGAVPLLSAALHDSKPAVAGSAAKALGQIGAAAPGDSSALEALRNAPNPAATAVVEAEFAILYARPPAEAAPVFAAISENAAVPAHLRAAAWLGQITSEPGSAPDRIVAALAGTDAALKPVAIEAIATFPNADLVRVLTNQLTTFDLPTQAAVIAALGRRGDPAATEAALTACGSPDPSVREAAITALGLLPGTPEGAALLASAVATGPRTEARLARESLARLNGPGVDEAVRTGATKGEPKLRVAFIEAIAARDMTDSVPLLLSLRADPDAKVRTAALASLAVLLPASGQAALLSWTLGATDPAEQSRALRSLATISLLNHDVTARAQPVIDAIEHASPATAVRLAPVLARLGGQACATCAAQLAERGDPALAAAAIGALAQWTDATAVPAFVAIATHATDAATRAEAVRTAAGFLDAHREIASAELSAAIGPLVDAAREPALRSRLVYLLVRCSDDAALTLAEKLSRDPALAADATDAARAIRANRAGPPEPTGSVRPEQIHNILDGKLATHWLVPAIPGQWIRLDFHSPRPVRRVVLDQGGSRDDYPGRLEVFLTDDPKKPGPVRASVAGQSNRTTVTIPPGARGRYLILRDTKGRTEGNWTVCELRID